MRSSTTFSIIFFVKKHRSFHGKAPIYARITVDGKRTDLSIKRKVESDRWDEVKGSARGNKPEVKVLNKYLEQVRSHLYECQQQLENERKLITAEAIKNRYLGQDERGKTLKELIEYHNEEMKSELAWGTQKNYRVTQRYIYEFLDTRKKTSNVYLDELNYKFVRDFEKFLKQRTPRGHLKPCGQNGCVKHIERLRKMVNLAIEEE